MSESNPYAAHEDSHDIVVDGVRTQYVNHDLENSVDAVPEGTIADVLGWVDKHPEKARVALEKEEAGEKRSSLIKTLKSFIKE